MAADAADQTFDTVEYRGQTISLSRSYADFDEYRDDPNNLPATVHAKVAKLVREAPVAAKYATRETASEALVELMFPGYGFSILGLDKPVALFSLEVPQANEQRFLAFVMREGAWALIDDFLWPDVLPRIEN